MSHVGVIGNFDGVHLGHQALLRHASDLAAGGTVTVVTFWPHPMSVIRPDLAPRLLCTLDQRRRLLAAHGADRVHSIDFTEQLAQRSPAEFVARHLEPLRLDLVLVGANFRFGHRAAGDVDCLRELGSFDVTALDLVEVGRRQVSSSTIRAALADGDVSTAADLLGRPFAYTGTVVRGHQRGREILGYPTANLPVPDDMAAPADGVYAGFTTRLDDPDALRWPAAISVGTNPTFDDVRHTVVESYVLDRDDLDLYDVPVAVEFTHRLRGMVKFDNLDGLRLQMDADVRQARGLVG